MKNMCNNSLISTLNWKAYEMFSVHIRLLHRLIRHSPLLDLLTSVILSIDDAKGGEDLSLILLGLILLIFF